MFFSQDGIRHIRCDSCDHEQALAMGRNESEIRAAIYHMFEIFMDRAICIDCRSNPEILEREQMKYALELIPQRFLEMHVVEFATWSPQKPGPRMFVLQWPFGFSHEPATIMLDRRVIRREDIEAIEVYIPDEVGTDLMRRYVNALRLADEAYQAMSGRQRHAT